MAEAPTPPPPPPPSGGGGGGGGGGGKTETLLLKIGIVGDSGCGKTSLMVRYVERRWDSSYVETLGVNFMEKTIALPNNTEVVRGEACVCGGRVVLVVEEELGYGRAPQKRGLPPFFSSSGIAHVEWTECPSVHHSTAHAVCLNARRPLPPPPLLPQVLSIWDLGGDQAYATMLPLTVVDAVAVLFCFDLTNRQSLADVREWYRQVRGLNKQAIAVLVGCKFDSFYTADRPTQEGTCDQARKFARAMRAPLVFCSSAMGIGVNRLFRLVFQRAFSLEVDVPQVHEVGEPLFEY